MNLKPEFTRFLGAQPGRLHFAAHSHHPWPDVSYEAHKRAWTDAADMMDDKWESVFGDVMPRLRSLIASNLSLADPTTIAFAPNTHEFVVRLFSCFEPPIRVLSSDAEFHSFTRQTNRWAEEGLVLIDRVPSEPFETFAERFTTQVRAGAHDIIFLSQVFFDSGFVVPDIDRIVSSASDTNAFIVIDGYHSFMARPVDLASIQERAFFLAGGYKYAMSGEGVCFMHCPPGYGERPVNTGWYAGFGELESGVGQKVPFSTDGNRFAGATFDPSGIYRMAAVLSWLRDQDIDAADISRYVRGLQEHFMSAGVAPGTLLPASELPRGNFLTFRTDSAGDLYKRLHEADVITDYRGDRLRIGFGVYQDQDDVDELIVRLRGVTSP